MECLLDRFALENFFHQAFDAPILFSIEAVRSVVECIFVFIFFTFAVTAVAAVIDFAFLRCVSVIVAVVIVVAAAGCCAGRGAANGLFISLANLIGVVQRVIFTIDFVVAADATLLLLDLMGFLSSILRLFVALRSSLLPI